MLRRLASFCYRRRWRVLIAWVVLLVGVNVLAQTVGGDLLKTFSLPGSESQAAFDTLNHNFGRKGDTGQLVFKATDPGAQVGADNVRPTIENLMKTLRAQPHVVSVASPFDPENRRFIAPGGRIAYAEILFDVQSNDVPVPVATHMRGLVSEVRRPACAGRARRLDVHRPDATRERGDRHPRGHPHSPARVRIAPRDGPADHDGHVRHRDRPRVRDAARARDGHPVVRAASHRDDRDRRRDRLRAVHQHALPGGAPRGHRPRTLGRYTRSTRAAARCSSRAARS